MAMFTTATAGSNFYIHNVTSTNTSATSTGTITMPISDVMMGQQLGQQIAESMDKDTLKRVMNEAFPRALRIAQHGPMNMAPVMTHGYEPKMAGIVPPEAITHGVVEIPAHRVARGLQWYKVEENTILELPDGTLVDAIDKYRWKVYEDNAKVTREACRLQAFNRFLNASELLEAFIKDMAPHGVRQDQILKVPVEAFINWLIYRAAEADGDTLPSSRYNHRCGYCKRFIPKRMVAQGVNFCGPDHLDGFLQRTDIKLLEAQ